MPALAELERCEVAARDCDHWEELQEDARYAPYVARQDAEIRSLRASDEIAIPLSFAFTTLAGLSTEMIERLERTRPRSLGAAGRIPGVTPAALAAVLVALTRKAA